MQVGSTASGLRIRFVTSVSDRRRTGNFPDLRLFAYVEFDFLLEAQFPSHLGIRADHDLGNALGAPHAEAALFFDHDVTFDARAFAYLNVAIHRLDAAADAGALEADATIHVLYLAIDPSFLFQPDAAIHRRNTAVDVTALLQVHAAIDHLDAPRSGTGVE